MKIKQITSVFVGAVAALTFGPIKKIIAVVKDRQLALAAIVVAFSAVAVAAVLTPGNGVVSTIITRASFTNLTSFTLRVGKGREQQVINVRAAQETAIGQLVWSPGGHTGWHTHPGPAVVLVKSGQLSFYDGEDPTCTARIYSAGQSFIDSGQGHVHLVRNESQTENAEVWTTYFDVPPGGATRIDAPNPGNCIGF